MATPGRADLIEMFSDAPDLVNPPPMHILRHWSSYPKSLATQSMLGEDREYYHRRLLEDSPRLFKNNLDGLEITINGWNNSICKLSPMRNCTGDRLPLCAAQQSLRIQHLDNLWQHLSAARDPGTDIAYIIRQEYTWDQFAISIDALRMILTFHQIFAPFLDCVHAFGMKTRESDESWAGSRRSIQVGSDGKCNSYEFCYNVRYVIRNERSSGPSWSLRQTAVYQQYTFKDASSTWILLQPSTDSQRRFQEVKVSDTGEESKHPMQYHVALLFSTATHWTEYIMHLRRDLDKLDDKACFSTVGKAQMHDFGVAFADSQRTQNIRQRLLRTSAILDAGLDIAKSCAAHCRDIDNGSTWSSHTVLLELEAYRSQLVSHKNVVTSLLEHSRGTMDLLFRVLEYRHSENFGRGAAALHKDVELLRDVALRSRTENQAMTKLAEQNQKDTRLLKSLSILATLYLPATFLATVFSSSLVQLQSTDDADRKHHFVLASDFWLFVVVAIPLMALTLAYTYWLERRQP